MDFELSPTDEERERAHGWERRPGSLSLLPEAEAFGAARRLLPPVEKLGPAEPSLAGAQQYAVDRYVAGRELEPQAQGDAAASALAGLAGFHGDRDPNERAAWPFVDYWVQRSGIVHAIDTLLEEAELDTFSFGGFGVRRATGNSLLEQGYLGKWQRLREVVNGLPERDYVAAVAHSEARRATLPLLLRAALAYAFPARPAWAEADARAAISAGDGLAFDLVAVSLPSPALLPEGLVLFGPDVAKVRARQASSG